VVSQVICRVTAPKSESLEPLVRAEVVAAGERATSAARRDICPGTALSEGTVVHVGRTTASATTAVEAGIFLVTAPRVLLGEPEEAVVVVESATRVEALIISSATVRRRPRARAVTRTCAATTAMRWATSRGTVPSLRRSHHVVDRRHQLIG